MAITQAKVRAIGYDSKSLLDEDLVDENSKFAGTGQFLLIANKPIPKNSKVYMEIEISSNANNKDIRHIPLCLGVHKEPSFGVLGSDCSLGAIYYTRNDYLMGNQATQYLAFCIRDKYQGQLMKYRYVKDTTARVPVKTTVIGLGIDMVNNYIIIYADGSVFYAYRPYFFNMNEEEEDFYLAVYCAEPGEYVSGALNYGRYRTKYLPEGFMDFYQELYDKIEVIKDITSYIRVPSIYDYSFNKDILAPCSCVMDNSMAPIYNNRRDIDLVLSNDDMLFYKDDDHTIVHKHAFSYSASRVDGMAYIKYPIGQDKRIYFEFHSQEATMKENQVGIPLTIGITKDVDDLTQEAFHIELFHLRTDGYHLYTYKDGIAYLAGNYNILNPNAPSQPNIIGVMLDLATNTIELYTEGTLFTVVQPNTAIVDFSNILDKVYFFFKPNHKVYDGEGYVVCNFGTKEPSDVGATIEEDDYLYPYIDEPLKWGDYLLDDISSMSLWWYYNYPIRERIYKDIPCHIKAISDHIPYSRYIFASITVADEEAKQWGPSLNALYGTYNKVDDREEHNNKPNVSIYDLAKQMREDMEDNQR